jgi:exonuclease 3'-5' domain-containing protein 1
MAESENIVLVDNESQLEETFVAIRSHKLIGVHCEGDESLSRDGTMTILALKTSDQSYLFDVMKLGQSVFEKGLKDILEDEDIVKLMFDSREDSDALWHLFNVKVNNVLDLQLMQILYERDHPDEKPERTKQIERNIEMYAMTSLPDRLASTLTRIRGLVSCIEWYLLCLPQLLMKKNAKTNIVKADTKIWSKRPLGVGMRSYAAVEVQAMFPLYEKLKSGLDEAAIKKVVEGSVRYAAHHREKEVRTHDMYEGNNLLPKYILEEPPDPSTRLYECEGCKIKFPAGDFSATGGMKCPVCRVKYYIDERDKKRRHQGRFNRF